ncbi:transcriptional regulator [Sphaerisporangium siamense]|nr:transcriptional regulator [Sphaerisporangium siamense]
MVQHGNPSVRRVRLGLRLRRLRERAGMVGDAAAARLGWSAAKVSRIETARTFPSVADVEDLMALYEAAPGVRQEVFGLYRDAGRRRWYDEYRGVLAAPALEVLDREAEAERAWVWEPQVIPALLRTHDYARLVMRGMHAIEPVAETTVARRLEALKARQAYLLDGSRPFTLAAVVHVSALRRSLGDARVLRDQLCHLAEMSRSEQVRLRVLAQESPHPMTAGPFVHLRFPDLPAVVYLEEILGTRLVSDAGQVRGYERAFDHLCAVALDEADSRLLIRDLAGGGRRP